MNPVQASKIPWRPPPCVRINQFSLLRLQTAMFHWLDLFKYSTPAFQYDKKKLPNGAVQTNKFLLKKKTCHGKLVSLYRA